MSEERWGMLVSVLCHHFVETLETENGGYCLVGEDGFVWDPSAKCKHVIRPHLLYPKHIPPVPIWFPSASVQWLKPSQHAGLQMQKPTHFSFGTEQSYFKVCSRAPGCPPHTFPPLTPLLQFFPVPQLPSVFVLGTHCCLLKKNTQKELYVWFVFYLWQLLLFSEWLPTRLC